MGKTLDYGSVGRWMSLAVYAAEQYDRRELVPGHSTDEEYRLFFHKIAQEALNRGFSLRAGYRAFALSDLLQAIAPHDKNMLAAYDRIDRETWLTPVGAKPNRRKD